MLRDKKHSIVNLSLGITRTDHPSIEIETRAEAFYTSAVLKKLFVKLDVKRSKHNTGMAQRKRARLITLRTQDRNLLPVFFTSCALKKHTVIAKRR